MYYLFVNFDLDDPILYASPFKTEEEAKTFQQQYHPNADLYVRVY